MNHFNENEIMAFPCSYCERIFPRKENLRKHINYIHKNKIKKIKCPICSTLYANLSNLRTHCEKHHGGKKIDEQNLKSVFIDQKCYGKKCALLLEVVYWKSQICANPFQQ